MVSFSFSTALLPSHLSYIEYWAARLFLLLAFLTIGPWLFLIVYDFLLYLFRIIAFEIPIFGGRAQGKARPRAPSVADVKTVTREGLRGIRRFSLVGNGGSGSGSDGITGFDGQQGEEKVDVRSRGVRRVLQEEERDMTSWEIVEDSEREDAGGGNGRRKR